MSIWNTLPIEEILEKTLIQSEGENKGKEYFSDYVTARRVLLENVLEEIKTSEPNLTDHGPSHIQDVLNRVHELLGCNIEKLNAIELYIMCVSVLFHDVGNFESRKNHNKKIAKIYDLVRKKENRFSTERNAVLAIAGAHCGKCSKGTDDSIKELRPQGVFGKVVDFQSIAALLRFADELAEGPQRTSIFMQSLDKYSDESIPFHRLANVTNYTIDSVNSRIQISYSIHIYKNDADVLTDGEISLKTLLDMMIDRILKVNAERKYCGFYCNYLKIFKEISVSFQFIYESEYLELGLEPIVLNDLVVPTKSLPNICAPDYTSENIYEKIDQEMMKLTTLPDK